MRSNATTKTRTRTAHHCSRRTTRGVQFSTAPRTRKTRHIRRRKTATLFSPLTARGVTAGRNCRLTHSPLTAIGVQLINLTPMRRFLSSKSLQTLHPISQFLFPSLPRFRFRSHQDLVLYKVFRRHDPLKKTQSLQQFTSFNLFLRFNATRARTNTGPPEAPGGGGGHYQYRNSAVEHDGEQSYE